MAVTKQTTFYMLGGGRGEGRDILLSLLDNYLQRYSHVKILTVPAHLFYKRTTNEHQHFRILPQHKHSLSACWTGPQDPLDR